MYDLLGNVRMQDLSPFSGSWRKVDPSSAGRSFIDVQSHATTPSFSHLFRDNNASNRGSSWAYYGGRDYSG